MKNFQKKPIVLIGMMGAGKSSVGRALAKLVGLPFYDADQEIEAAAGRKVAQIFSEYGEAEFRRLERQVVARLLGEERCVLSLGGGAFMDQETRARVKATAFSIWLNVEQELLVTRVLRHGERPMLKNSDPREKMASLLAMRAPVYAEADLTVVCDDRPVAETARRVFDAMQAVPASRIGQE